MSAPATALITGFPSTELACWVLEQWLAGGDERRATCVVPERFEELANERLALLPEAQAARMTLLRGDAAHMDLGLSGKSFLTLAGRVSVIHHCAAMVYTGSDPQRAAHFNRQAAREVLELADAATDLQQLVHWSSTRAVGAMGGAVQEGFLVSPDRGPIAASRYDAERMMREASNGGMPITVLRPANLVGDTQTGRWPRIEGAYLIARALLNSSSDLPLPMPARRSGVLNVVPVDYAARAGCKIAEHPSSIGRTFHIVDPQPPSVAEAFRLFAQITGRPEPHRGLPSPIASAILNVPGISKLAHGQRDLLDEVGRRVRYDDRNARAILEPAGLRCPPLSEYAPQLVEFVRTSAETAAAANPAAPAS